MSSRRLEPAASPAGLACLEAGADTIDVRGAGSGRDRDGLTHAATLVSPRVRDTITATGPLVQLPDEPAPGGHATGSRLGQYELVRELGRGGMGTVYLARDLRLGRLVAIKLLAPRSGRTSAHVLAEARVTARCNHENIVVIHDIGEHGRQPYLVFEYVAGQTLRDWLDDRTRRSEAAAPIEPKVAAALMLPVVHALAYAHSMGIVHRDLKPANIMLTDAGTIKVLDFGIAKLVASDQVSGAGNRGALSEPAIVIGTLPYMSPEQLDGGVIDHRSDIWAVGIMLYQMVTGSHPVIRDGVNLHSALLELASLEVAMPSVAERRSDLGPLAGIIDRCLIKDPAHRTGDAHVLAQELQAMAAGRRGGALRDDDNPFAGLAAFQEADADRFYGRTREVAAVLARLRSCPLVALAGPSGVGKSSLVRAGVIPLLKRSGEGWDAFVVRPGRSPLTALSSILLELTGEPVARGDQPADLRAAPGQLGAALRSWAHARRRRVMVFVDQFEELYTLCVDPDERAAFLACLEGVADDAGSPLRVVVSIRSDFLDRLAEHRRLAAGISSGLILVPPLDADGLRDALVRPVEAADHRYEDPALVDDMLAAVVAAPSSLPVLQFAAARLWTERDRERRLLTRASYTAMGGIAGTLAGHADTVLGAIAPRDHPLVRAIFERLVTPEHTRAVVTMRELRELPGDPDDAERLIHRLVDARLLVVEARAGDDRVVELVHESLIAGWPTLVGWLHENRDDAAVLSRLRTAANQWQASGRDDGVLWRDEPARQALAWWARYRGELGRRERAYLEAVRKLVARTQRWRRLRRRQAITAAVTIPVILLVIAGGALVRISRAERMASQQRDELRETTAQLRSQAIQLRSQAAELEASRDELEAALVRLSDKERENGRLLVQTLEAAQRVEIERDEARRQKSTAERARDHATWAARQAEREQANAERAAREADDARAREAAAAERVRRSEHENRLLRERAVGPIQQRLQ